MFRHLGRSLQLFSIYSDIKTFIKIYEKFDIMALFISIIIFFPSQFL